MNCRRLGPPPTTIGTHVLMRSAAASTNLGTAVPSFITSRLGRALITSTKGVMSFKTFSKHSIDAMIGLGSRRGDIMASLGPTISAAAYEVGPEFVARFREAGEEVDRWFAPSTRAGHAMFDLPGYIIFRLERAGIRATNLALCTYGDEARFFSYRRMTLNGDADYGRHLAAIALEGP